MTTDIRFLDLDAMHAPIRKELDEIWHDVVNANAFIGGSYGERFEQAWADYCGTSHAVGSANGTDAIELILRALSIWARRRGNRSGQHLYRNRRGRRRVRRETCFCRCRSRDAIGYSRNRRAKAHRALRSDHCGSSLRPTVSDDRSRAAR